MSSTGRKKRVKRARKKVPSSTEALKRAANSEAIRRMAAVSTTKRESKLDKEDALFDEFLASEIKRTHSEPVKVSSKQFKPVQVSPEQFSNRLEGIVGTTTGMAVTSAGMNDGPLPSSPSSGLKEEIQEALPEEMWGSKRLEKETAEIWNSTPKSTRTRASSVCSDPNCKQCKARREKESVAVPQPQYYTGLRVQVQIFTEETGPESDFKTLMKDATVIGGFEPERMAETGLVAVCYDAPVAGARSESLLNDLTKPGYGRFIPAGRVTILKDQESYEAFRGIPNHIGVVVNKTATVDGVTFRSGKVGRILRASGADDERFLVNWSFTSPHFFDGSDYGTGPHGQFTNCFNVPRSMLAFCRINRARSVCSAVWPGETSVSIPLQFKEGEYLVARLVDPVRISHMDRNFLISPGTIVKYGQATNSRNSQVYLAGGCDPAILGLPTIIGTKGLEKFKGEFIEVGSEVEITATLDFRKRDLKGMRAVVLLPLDQDEEFGLQFKEDIDAGSLDGYGPDKRCLYIHRDTVKKVSV